MSCQSQIQPASQHCLYTEEIDWLAGWTGCHNPKQCSVITVCVAVTSDARPAGLPPADEAASDMWQGSEKESDKVQSKKSRRDEMK